MNKGLTRICSVLVLIQLLRTGVVADTTTNSVSAEIARATAAGDFRSVIRAVPGLEQLWPQSPDKYFESAAQAARVLGAAFDDPEAKKSFLDLFDKLLEKHCPEDHAKAAFCFERKSDTVLYGFNFDEIRKDKSRLIAIANFDGEVRSRREPNYATRGTCCPGREILEHAGVMNASALTDPVLKQAYEKAVQDNKQDLIMNDLQFALTRNDNPFVLIHNCSQFFPASDPQNADFLKKIVEAAHLTNQEQKDLYKVN